jgi:hypothetical protein
VTDLIEEHIEGSREGLHHAVDDPELDSDAMLHELVSDVDGDIAALEEVKEQLWRALGRTESRR